MSTGRDDTDKGRIDEPAGVGQAGDGHASNGRAYLDDESPVVSTPAKVIEDEPVETPEVDESTYATAEEEYGRVTMRLVRTGKIERKHAYESYLEWRKHGLQDQLWRTVAGHPDVDPDLIFSAAAEIYAFKRANVGDGRPDHEFVKRTLASFSSEQQEQMFLLRLLPFEYEIDPERGALKLVFATPDPTKPETLKFTQELNLEHFDIYYAPPSQLEPLMIELFPRKNEYLERLASGEDAFDFGASFDSEDSTLVDEDALDAEINRSNLINLFEAALLEAVRDGASDVHILPRDRVTEFWFRIDGALQLWHTQDKVHPEAMIAVAKDRCGNIDRFEREAAQDGFIQRMVDHSLIRYRVSVLPIASPDRTIKAESIVIRVLDDRNVFSDLGAIGLLSGALARFQKAIQQPQGMVIMTGPTGSGKSTTLVAAIHGVLRPEVNILTVEDPVEYLIRGVRQIKLGPRLDLANAMRSILRHDPDIVMVGEMRDQATAELAIKLANTGHLTFSTLHTNDAPSAVSRLYKMGIEPFLIAYAINLVVAQRLLRKLCTTCRKVDDDPDIVVLKELGFSEKEISETDFYTKGERPTCRECNGVGFKGRRAIAEALHFSRAIRHLIFGAGENINEDAIRDKAIEEGMLTLIASAREVVKFGETSIEEVIRVTAADD
jgi:type IV pilus assembly protein PilB